MILIPSQPKTSIDDYDHAVADACVAPEAYGRVDANGNRFPAGCSYAPLKIASTPEYQALNSQAIDAMLSAKRWSTLARAMIEARETIKTAKPTREEQDELVESMCRTLGAGISEALSRRDERKLECDDCHEKMSAMAEPHEAARRNHPDSNTSGQAIVDANYRKKREQIDATGCCGGEPMQDGVCFGVGMCPRAVEIKTCETFANGVVEWAEQVNEQSALAAITARLSVPSPVIDSEVHNV